MHNEMGYGFSCDSGLRNVAPSLWPASTFSNHPTKNSDDWNFSLATQKKQNLRIGTAL